MSAPMRHGHTSGKLYGSRQRSPTYETWLAMHSRCTNEKNIGFKRYAAKGVAVCERWRSFDDFLADMGERPKGMSLDRIDNAMGYEPSNCRWATMKEQANNRSNNLLLTHAGKTMTQAAWAAEIGISIGALSHRIRGGWSVERALTEPRRSYPKHRKSGGGT